MRETQPRLRLSSAFTETDAALSRTMREAGVRFAASGNPNGAGLRELPAYARGAEQLMEFGDRVKIGRNLRQEACDLFDRLGQLPLQAD
ncbi:MAG: hypothetical protein ACOY3P_15705 [Planctomycetota bacterium]